MLGKIEGRRRRGCQRIRWLHGINNAMDRNLRLLATVDVVITSDSQPITSTHTALGIRDPAMTKSVQEGTGASMDLLPDRPQTSRGDCISKGCHCPVILPRRNLDVRSLPKVTDNQKT